MLRLSKIVKISRMYNKSNNLSSKDNTYIQTQRNSVNVPRGGGYPDNGYLPGL